MMTYLEAVTKASNQLKDAGIEEYAIDAMWLLTEVLSMSRTQYLMKQRDVMPQDMKEKYFDAVQRRATREPLQYIVGHAYFMGYCFKTTSAVLIPRQDTECLVEEAEKILSAFYGDRECDILDMCTGSGCIVLSLAARNERIKGVAADISDEALAIALENKQLLQCKNVEFVQSDLFDNVRGKFDIIVSNPPYIRTKDIEGLMDEVREFEPFGALDGYEDGLHFYEEITRNAPCYLNDGGFLCYEIGCDQGSDVCCIMERYGFEECRVIKDLAGLDRVVIGRKKQEE